MSDPAIERLMQSMLTIRESNPETYQQIFDAHAHHVDKTIVYARFAEQTLRQAGETDGADAAEKHALRFERRRNNPRMFFHSDEPELEAVITMSVELSRLLSAGEEEHMACNEVPALVIDFIRSGLYDPEVNIAASAMVEFPAESRVRGWPTHIIAVRFDDHGEYVDGTWAHGGTGGTEALNYVARGYTDLGAGIPSDSKGGMWREFVHAVSFDEAAEALACLDRCL